MSVCRIVAVVLLLTLNGINASKAMLSAEEYEFTIDTLRAENSMLRTQNAALKALLEEANVKKMAPPHIAFQNGARIPPPRFRAVEMHAVKVSAGGLSRDDCEKQVVELEKLVSSKDVGGWQEVMKKFCPLFKGGHGAECSEEKHPRLWRTKETSWKKAESEKPAKKNHKCEGEYWHTLKGERRAKASLEQPPSTPIEVTFDASGKTKRTTLEIEETRKDSYLDRLYWRGTVKTPFDGDTGGAGKGASIWWYLDDEGKTTGHVRMYLGGSDCYHVATVVPKVESEKPAPQNHKCEGEYWHKSERRAKASLEQPPSTPIEVILDASGKTVRTTLEIEKTNDNARFKRLDWSGKVKTPFDGDTDGAGKRASITWYLDNEGKTSDHATMYLNNGNDSYDVVAVCVATVVPSY